MHILEPVGETDRNFSMTRMINVPDFALNHLHPHKTATGGVIVAFIWERPGDVLKITMMMTAWVNISAPVRVVSSFLLLTLLQFEFARGSWFRQRVKAIFDLPVQAVALQRSDVLLVTAYSDVDLPLVVLIFECADACGVV